MPHTDDSGARRTAMTFKTGALACVLVLVALAAAQRPATYDATEAMAESAAHSTPAAEKPYYFPSQYDLQAPAVPGEASPTF